MDAADACIVVDVGEHAAHLESIDRMPEGDVRGNEVRVGERSNAKRSVGRNHQSVGGEVTVPGVNDGIEHGFKEEAVTHPFGDDDVDLLDGESHFFDFATDAPVIKGSI